jgi:hypothetical protein
LEEAGQSGTLGDVIGSAIGAVSATEADDSKQAENSELAAERSELAVLSSGFLDEVEQSLTREPYEANPEAAQDRGVDEREPPANLEDIIGRALSASDEPQPSVPSTGGDSDEQAESEIVPTEGEEPQPYEHEQLVELRDVIGRAMSTLEADDSRAAVELNPSPCESAKENNLAVLRSGFLERELEAAPANDGDPAGSDNSLSTTARDGPEQPAGLGDIIGSVLDTAAERSPSPGASAERSELDALPGGPLASALEATKADIVLNASALAGKGEHSQPYVEPVDEWENIEGRDVIESEMGTSLDASALADGEPTERSEFAVRSSGLLERTVGDEATGHPQGPLEPADEDENYEEKGSTAAETDLIGDSPGLSYPRDERSVPDGLLNDMLGNAPALQNAENSPEFRPDSNGDDEAVRRSGDAIHDVGEALLSSLVGGTGHDSFHGGELCTADDGHVRSSVDVPERPPHRHERVSSSLNDDEVVPMLPGGLRNSFDDHKPSSARIAHDSDTHGERDTQRSETVPDDHPRDSFDGYVTEIVSDEPARNSFSEMRSSESVLDERPDDAFDGGATEIVSHEFDGHRHNSGRGEPDPGSTDAGHPEPEGSSSSGINSSPAGNDEAVLDFLDYAEPDGG